MRMKVDTVMFRAIRRSIIEGICGMVKNGLMTVTSVFVVTACIFIFGIFLMITFNINNMTSLLADEYHVDVYVGKSAVTDTVSYDEVKENVRKEIMKIDNIDTTQISLISGEEKFKATKEGMTEDELKAFEGLPDDFMPDAFSLKLEDINKVDETSEALSAIEGVESVENSNDLANLISGIKDTVKTFSVWIIVIFAIISLFIISNTIKLTVHNRRREINIMKYVGATDSYIKGPFIMEGMLVGIISAVVAFFISQWSYLGLMTSIPMMPFSIGLLAFEDIWVKLIGVYVLLGCIIGAFGSWISVRRYLRV